MSDKFTTASFTSVQMAVLTNQLTNRRGCRVQCFNPHEADFNGTLEVVTRRSLLWWQRLELYVKLDESPERFRITIKSPAMVKSEDNIFTVKSDEWNIAIRGETSAVLPSPYSLIKLKKHLENRFGCKVQWHRGTEEYEGTLESSQFIPKTRDDHPTPADFVSTGKRNTFVPKDSMPRGHERSDRVELHLQTKEKTGSKMIIIRRVNNATKGRDTYTFKTSDGWIITITGKTNPT